MAQLDPGSPGPHVGQGRLEPPTSRDSDHYRAFLIPKFVAQAGSVAERLDRAPTMPSPGPCNLSTKEQR